MTSRSRITSTAVGYTLVAVMAANPAATPTYSAWSPPVNLGPTINTSSTDAGPAISKDGLSLYFNSNRAGGFGDNDIWVSQRASAGAPWGTPQNLGPVVNSGALEGVPALSRDGHWLLFNSNRAGGYGQIDVWGSYRSNIHDDFAWEAPVNLGEGVNSASFEAGAAFFENDEGGPPLLFFASTRSGGFGSFDIYASSVTPDGSLGPATLVPELSSSASDQRPSVRFDGLEMFFQSDRFDSLGGSDLWVSTRVTVSQAWSVPVNLGPTVNSTATEQQPYIAADRETLFFASNRPGGVGGLDLYVTTRTKIPGR
jgi:hypothetical protein